MEEYKAKLAEKRREAREKAEREAEEERQRLEAERLADEERQREEEEKQRLFELEQDRLAAEARQAEQVPASVWQHIVYTDFINRLPYMYVPVKWSL